MVSSKKKGLHFHLLSDFPIFVPKSECPLKKKVFTSVCSQISLFSVKIRVFSKKKRSSLRFHLRFLYFPPKITVFSKKKRSSLRIVLYTLNKHLQRIETVCAIFKGAPKIEAKKGGLRQRPHLAHPISTTGWEEKW